MTKRRQTEMKHIVRKFPGAEMTTDRNVWD